MRAGDSQLASRQLFICYRRVDTADVAGRLYDRLANHFGRETVFKDVDSIPLGIDFRVHIDQVIKDCKVVIVMIGDRWLDVRSADGKMRLEQPLDHVRIEIQSALVRGIPIIPLLIHEAEMPLPEALPEPIRDLAYRSAATLRSDPHFHSDTSFVIEHLERLLAPLEEPQGPEAVENVEQPPVAEGRRDIEEGSTEKAPNSEPENPAVELQPESHAPTAAEPVGPTIVAPEPASTATLPSAADWLRRHWEILV